MAGLASRRKAEELILQGLVSINGKIVTNLSTKVNSKKDIVRIDRKVIHPQEEKVYIIFNKPKDCITTTKDERDRTTVFNYVHTRERVFPIGRLDRNTTGVLLLTNDGDFAHHLMHPSFEVEKMYHAKIDKSLDSKDLKRLETGIIIDRKKTSNAKIMLYPKTHNKEFVITIHEGRNRQVRKMLEVLGYDVEKLDRVSYAGLTTSGLKRGQWRFLSHKEILQIKNLISKN